MITKLEKICGKKMRAGNKFENFWHPFAFLKALSTWVVSIQCRTHSSVNIFFSLFKWKLCEALTAFKLCCHLLNPPWCEVRQPVLQSPGQESLPAPELVEKPPGPACWVPFLPYPLNAFISLLVWMYWDYKTIVLCHKTRYPKLQ